MQHHLFLLVFASSSLPTHKNTKEKRMHCQLASMAAFFESTGIFQQRCGRDHSSQQHGDCFEVVKMARGSTEKLRRLQFIRAQIG
jgi:hypothetical protein